MVLRCNGGIALAHLLNSQGLLAAPRTADYAVLARSIDELDEHARAGRESRMLDLLHRHRRHAKAGVAPGVPPDRHDDIS